MKSKTTIINLIFLVLCLPSSIKAHPGIGIVKDSKDNIYYTDLLQVWKITNGTKSVIVPNVHTHELYVDKDDNLFGEGLYYEARANKFYHYLWVYHPNGTIDTVVGIKQAYVDQDFSLTRDNNGNEYYVKKYGISIDTTHLYRRSVAGKETIVGTGNFAQVKWFHVLNNRDILYVQDNSILRIDSTGKTSLIKAGIGNKKLSFGFPGIITTWGLWTDNEQNIYAAVFSDQAVKKIDPNGSMTIVYESTGNWTPIHGIFDN
ncbi:MAG TPA: hypothetical protein VLC28_16570, partial [Flavitalea sp.]|nr:hypothetical protein [Flavitalea sp.]